MFIFIQPLKKNEHPVSKVCLTIILLFLSIGAYAPSIDNSFVYDDIVLLSHDQRVTERGYLKEIWKTDYWPGGRTSYAYRPITTTSYALLNRFGLNQRAANILLHAACSIMTVQLSFLLGLSTPFALLAGTIFILHPLHSEAIYLIVGRGELLAAFFGFLFLIGFLRKWNSIVLGVLLLAALLSKESAAMLPVLCVLIYATYKPKTPLKEFFPIIRRSFLISLPFIVLFFLLRFQVFGHFISPKGYCDPLYNPLVSLPTSLRILNACWVLVLYFIKMIVPFPLRADYSWNQIELFYSFADIKVIVILVLIGLGFVLLFKSKKVQSLEATGIFFAALSFLPVSNILFTSGVMFGERLTYFPLFGFCILIASLIQRLWVWKTRSKPMIAKTAATLLIYLILTSYLTSIIIRDRDWQNENAFTLALVNDSPQSAFAHGMRFLYLNEHGDKDLAEKHLLQALDLYPSYYDAWDSYGEFLTTKGQFDKAVFAYIRAAEEVAKTPYDHEEAGIFYSKAAILELKMRRCADAKKHIANAEESLNKPYPQYFQRLKEIETKKYNCK